MLRADFVTKDGRKILLHARLAEQPGQRFSAANAELICNELRNFRDSLAKKLHKAGCDVNIRAYFDTYASSLFWYLLLNRPVMFYGKGTFAGRPWSVREIMDDPQLSGELKKIDLGVVFDRENNYLVILWEQAQASGLLSDWDSCISWRWLKKKLSGRRYYGGAINNDELQHRLACESSWVLTRPELERICYITKRLWYVEDLQYADITVLDLAGLPALEDTLCSNGQQINRVGLPAPVQARYCRFYVEDQKEFDKMREDVAARQAAGELTPAEITAALIAAEAKRIKRKRYVKSKRHR